MATVIHLDLSKRKTARLTTRVSGRTISANNIVELKTKLHRIARQSEGNRPCPAA